MKKFFTIVLIYAIGLAYIYTLSCRVDGLESKEKSLVSNYEMNEIYN